jgi:D-alanyl-D-alanine carboxypeptidase-like protein
MTVGARVRRRRLAFVALLSSTLILGTLAFVRADDRVTTSTESARPSPATSPATSSRPAASEQPSSEMPPAWLAWITGSLPRGFAPRAAATPSLGTVVVVAGDTRWMNASHDAAGNVVDRPAPPYTIPIDAFAVDPRAYAPFVPDAFRADVIDALRSGAAVLGESSAKLRRLGVGGALTFGDRTVDVGAVVPDEVAGWSEMLVSRTVGRALGIVDDRYLLSQPPGEMTQRRFSAIMRKLLPDTNVRMLPPGGSTYMRIASGVNPPVVMKEVFGEFAAYPRSDDPAFLNVDPAWYDANIATRSVPLLGSVTCNKRLFPQLIGALTDVLAAGLGGEIHVYSGCYAARTVARSPTAPPSQHAYGAAIDIDAPENPYGGTPTMDPRIVRIFQRWGFIWGGRFLTPDGMHFEYGGPPRQAG